MRNSLIVLGLALILVVGMALALDTGMRERGAGAVRWARDLALGLADGDRVRADSQGHWTNVVFLHHSVGRGIIRDGRLRQRLAEAGLKLYDHDYNSVGLVGPDGSRTGYGYRIPEDDTDPPGLARIFEQRAWKRPWNAWSALLQHEVIAVKSCFLAIRTLGDDDVRNQKACYLRIREAIDRHQDRLFIILTSPPANPVETDPGSAARARSLAGWLASEAFREGRRNLYVFDLFGLLAENDAKSPEYGMLRAQCRRGNDSHPVAAAGEIVGRALATFIVEARQKYCCPG